MFRDDPEEAQEVLRELLIENINKVHIMEGILHLLHDFDYEEVPLINDFVIEQCFNHKSNIVREVLIRVFENWDIRFCP